MGDAGATALAQALAKSATLEMLDVDANGLGGTGKWAFGRACSTRRIVVLLSAATVVRGETAARDFVKGDGDRAIISRVLEFICRVMARAGRMVAEVEVRARANKSRTSERVAVHEAPIAYY